MPKRATARSTATRAPAFGTDVSYDELRLSARVVHQRRGLLATDFVEIGDHDVGAFTGHTHRNRATESGTRTGDDHDSSFETHVDAPTVAISIS